MRKSAGEPHFLKTGGDAGHGAVVRILRHAQKLTVLDREGGHAWLSAAAPLSGKSEREE